MSLCACTCGAFSLHYFPCAAKRGEGELLSSILGFAYVNDFRLDHRSQVSSKLQLQRFPLSTHIWRALSSTRKNKDKGILHCGSEWL